MTPLLRANCTNSATVVGEGIGLPFAVVPCSVPWAPDGPSLYYTVRRPRAPSQRGARRMARLVVGNIPPGRVCLSVPARPLCCKGGSPFFQSYYQNLASG